MLLFVVLSLDLLLFLYIIFISVLEYFFDSIFIMFVTSLALGIAPYTLFLFPWFSYPSFRTNADFLLLNHSHYAVFLVLFRNSV